MDYERRRRYKNKKANESKNTTEATVDVTTKEYQHVCLECGSVIQQNVINLTGNKILCYQCLSQKKR